MTRTHKQILPALHDSTKVKDSDLTDIGEKNYTSTVLKYANLALPFPQLKTKAKRIVPAINELHDKESASALTDLTDVDISGVTNGQTLVYNSSEQKWINGTGGKTYTAGKCIEISNQNAISVDMIKSTAADIEQTSIDNPNSLVYTEGDVFTSGLTAVSVGLVPDAWEEVNSELQQSVSVRGVTASSNMVYSADYHTAKEYMLSGIYVVDQGVNRITFAVSTNHTPESLINVNIIYW